MTHRSMRDILRTLHSSLKKRRSMMRKKQSARIQPHRGGNGTAILCRRLKMMISVHKLRTGLTLTTANGFRGGAVGDIAQTRRTKSLASVNGA